MFVGIYIFPKKIFLNMNIPICIGLLASFQLATSKIESEAVSRNDGINPGIITEASFTFLHLHSESFPVPVQMCF